MFSHDQVQVLRITITTIASVSVLASAIVLFIFLWLHEVQKSYSSQIIFMMLLADSLSSVGWGLTPFSGNATVCTIQAFLLQFFDVSAFLWTSCLALNAWYTTVKERKMTSGQLGACYIICFGIPAAIAFYCLGKDYLGPSDSRFNSWCWIKPQYSMYRMLFYYGPLVCMWIFNSFLYFGLIYRMYGKNTKKSMLRRKATRMILSFMATFIGCKLFPLINRVQNAVNENNPIFALVLMQAITDPLRGLADSAVYAFAKLSGQLELKREQAEFKNQFSQRWNNFMLN